MDDSEPSVYRRCPACERDELKWNFPNKTAEDPEQECEFCIAEEIAVHGMKRYRRRLARVDKRPVDCYRRQNAEFD